MIIVLKVLSYNGVPTDGPSVEFDEIGGTIGRTANNDLVLPDPTCTISRQQAIVLFRAGKFAILDKGSNPISVNGTPVGAGREHPLRPGDQLQIGDYELNVEETTLGAALLDPSRGVFREVDGGLAQPPSSINPVPQKPASAPRPPTVDIVVGGPAGGGDSIIGKFPSSGTPSTADPLGTWPSRVPQPPPNKAPRGDPLQLLPNSAPASPPSRADHDSDLNTPIAAPLCRRAPVAASPGRASPPLADQQDLLDAFLTGLGTPDLGLDALTPATMQLIGQLLRESMRSTVEQLLARAALKDEMGADDRTRIRVNENNPLKFSPTVEVAMKHLLGPQTSGFMAPDLAMREACDDLRAHQLGVMAGMRAALDGVLQRFDPQQLERKLTHRSAISTLIPAARKAKLWESFQELFAQLQAEAQDDFDDLFGHAFLLAYQDQLDRMSKELGPR